MLDKKLELELLEFLVTPLVRFALRRSHAIQTIITVLKAAYVKVATEEIERAGQEVNVSRLSIMSGIHRGEVKRLMEEGEVVEPNIDSELSRVIGQWRHAKHFTNKAGKPRILSTKGSENEFKRLVQTVSKNLKPGTVAFELIRLGWVKEHPEGLELELETGALKGRPKQGFKLLGDDLNTLITAVSENLFEQNEISNLHIRTEYDNISRKDLDEIRRWMISRGKQFHREVREYLSDFDHDVNPEIAEEDAGGKVVVSAFSFTAE